MERGHIPFPQKDTEVPEDRLEADPDGREPPNPEREGRTDGRRVKKKDLINTLNFLNFQGKPLFVGFRDRKYDSMTMYPALPDACGEDSVFCRWSPGTPPAREAVNGEFDHFLISGGREHIVVSPRVLEVTPSGIRFALPEFGIERSRRRVARHSVDGVGVKVLQNGVMFSGRLSDFSPVSFLALLERREGQSFQWLNPDEPVTVIFEKEGKLIYSGECGILCRSWSESSRVYMFTPRRDCIRRYRGREFRSLRHHTVPAPNVVFRHPVTEKRVFLRALDISSSGLAVEESSGNSVLMPGLILPRITIEIAGSFSISCAAQVLYRKVRASESGEEVVRCGIALLDMDIQDQTRISALLHQATNPKTYVCNEADMDALWQFFFESGFIYPSKYEALRANKEEFKRTYENLYLKSPSIARHFVFQDKGSLFGHMSMLRFYQNAWLIHHHAASRKGPVMAGVEVLDQVGSYVNEFHTLHSTHMDFVICYFRPENRFPNRVFGGVVRDIADPRGASLDTFAYLHPTGEYGGGGESFQLFPAGPGDLEALGRFYERRSGGLMLDALDLKNSAGTDENLSQEYRRHGFSRQRHLFALKQEDALRAVFMVTLSDLGLNLSNLTRCVHAFVLDAAGLSPGVLMSAYRRLRSHFDREELPLLIFPSEYAENRTLDFEKKYTLWVLNLLSLDGYFTSIHKTFKRMPHA